MVAFRNVIYDIFLTHLVFSEVLLHYKGQCLGISEVKLIESISPFELKKNLNDENPKIRDRGDVG
jgi:hypothetical protein